MRIYRYIGVTTTPIDLKNVVLTIKDNVAESVEVKFGEGNFTYTRAVTYEPQLDKGSLDTVVLGDEVQMDISFGGRWDYVSSAGTDITVTDALYGEGGADAWESTAASISGQECAPYCTELQLVNTPSCVAGLTSPVETIRFLQFRADNVAYDVSAGTLAVSGKSNTTRPTVSRASS